MAERTAQLRIERAGVEDSEEIREVALRANIDAWSASDYAAEIHRADSVVLKASAGGVVEGMLVSRLVPGITERPDAELYNIAVSTGSKRKGIGTRLLSELVSVLKQGGVGNLWLEVRESNIEAIRFYEKHGFAAEITRSNFYSNPSENAVIMRLRVAKVSDVTRG